MLRKKAPRLAAAFVVTISAGCGGTSTPDSNQSQNADQVKQTAHPQSWFVKGPEGKCFIEHMANPPWLEPADCETQQALKKVEEKIPPKEPPPQEPPPPDVKPSDVKPSDVKPSTSAVGLTPRPPDDSHLPEASAGENVIKNPDGSCRVFAPRPKCPPGMRCNPPPPRNVKCPSKSTQNGPDPSVL
jgi:hypothetical protein